MRVKITQSESGTWDIVCPCCSSKAMTTNWQKALRVAMAHANVTTPNHRYKPRRK